MKFNNTDITTVGLHIGLGLVAYFFKPFAKVYFISLLIVFGYRIIMASNNQRVFEILKACAYFVGAEVFFRMTKGSISYEASKYLVICFSVLGMFYKGISGKGYPYFIYILCMVPSIFVASTTLSFDANFKNNIAFVLSGPVCLGVISLFSYDKRMSLNQLGYVLLMMLLPIITMTAYLFFYNPSIEEVLSHTSSNYAASGGFGPNQVATVLGLGMFICAIRFFMYSPTLQSKILYLIIFGLISYRALVTFSRGGVIAAIITITAFLYFYYLAVNFRKKNELLFLIAIFFGGMFLTWTISTIKTRGYIELRYENKDALGREKGDMTTGRTELFLEEIEGFMENPFFGIGSSRAKDQRIEEEGQGVVSHNEISRTLAEHGIFGIAMLGILILMPLYYRSRNKRNLFFFSFLAFWFATINHSGMRIAAPAFVYALALLNVTYEKRSLRRQQPEAIKE